MEKVDLIRSIRIFSEKGIEIHLANEIGVDGLKLLKSTTYGTKGPKYIHTNQLERTSNLSNPQFFSLYFHDKLIGLYCLCKRIIHNKNH